MDVKRLIDVILKSCEAERMLPPLKTRLVKLLYLIELEYHRRAGRRLTELDWKFYHYGPYAFALGDLLGNPDEDRLAWMQTVNHVQACVTDVVHQWGDADLNDLLDYVYFETGTDASSEAWRVPDICGCCSVSSNPQRKHKN